MLDKLGSFLGMGKASGAMDSMAAAQAAINAIKVPEVEEQKVKLEQMVLEGKLTPDEANTYLQEATGLKEISIDPKLKSAQMGALSSLQEIGDSGGLRMSDKARLAEVSAEIGAQERGSREAILSSAKQRGLGGSGLELASQLQNQQGAASRRSQEGMNTAARAEDRALQALLQGGEMAGSLRGQDFEEQSRVQQAQDQINSFNTANKQQVQNVNVDRRNMAKGYNLDNTQRISDSNVGIRNTQETTNKGLTQQKFNNELSKAQASANVAAQMSSMQEAGAARKDQFGGSIIGAAGDIISDRRAKENIRNGDGKIDKFLESLTVSEYDYKPPFDDGQKHVSVMAQDLEKTPMGRRAVEEDGQGVKRVDYSELLPEILASLAHLNKKIG